MPTGEPPHEIKGSAPMYLPQLKVVWKKCNTMISAVQNNVRYAKQFKICHILHIWNAIIMSCGTPATFSLPSQFSIEIVNVDSEIKL